MTQSMMTITPCAKFTAATMLFGEINGSCFRDASVILGEATNGTLFDLRVKKIDNSSKQFATFSHDKFESICYIINIKHEQQFLDTTFIR